MNSLILQFLILFFVAVNSYKYINTYSWSYIRKVLNTPNIDLDKKNELKKIIFESYKSRSYLKVKDIKLFNKELSKNVSIKNLENYALNGLIEAIDNFDPLSKTNFAKHSDKYIYKNIIIGLHKLNPLINTQDKKEHLNYYFRWWDPYWTCIDDNLSPISKEILKKKFSYNFFEIRSNEEVAKLLNITRESVTETIISSTKFIDEKVRNEFELGNKIFMRKNKIF